MNRDDTALALNGNRTVDNLSYVLTELRNQESSDSALAYALNAQLQVLSVINSPGLSISLYDLMIDSLKMAIQKARSWQEKAEYQRCAAIMTNSMVFFLHAKLCWEGDRWSEQGISLLKSACNLVSDSAIALIKIKTGAVLLDDSLGTEMFYNLISNANGFMNKLFDWFVSGDRVAQYQNEFYIFLLRLFDKLERYHTIYGQQVLLKELILRYKDELVFVAGDKSCDLMRLDPNSPFLESPPPFKDRFKLMRSVLSGIPFLLVLVVVFIVFNIFAGDKWLESFGSTALFYPLFSFHFFFLEFSTSIQVSIIIALLVGARLISIRKNNIGKKALEDYQRDETARIYCIADEYFTEIANLY